MYKAPGVLVSQTWPCPVTLSLDFVGRRRQTIRTQCHSSMTCSTTLPSAFPTACGRYVAPAFGGLKEFEPVLFHVELEPHLCYISVKMLIYFFLCLFDVCVCFM